MGFSTSKGRVSFGRSCNHGDHIGGYNNDKSDDSSTTTKTAIIVTILRIVQ